MRRNAFMGILALASFLSISLLSGCGGDGGNPAPTGAKVQTGDPVLAAEAGFVGSAKCQPCHPNEFAAWSNTLHNKPLKYFSELGSGILVNDRTASGVNDFARGLNFNNFSSNGKVSAAGFAAGETKDLVDNTGKLYPNPFNARKPNAPILSSSGSKFFIQMGSTKYEIQRTQGGNGYWKQRYHTRIGNGYYVTPVQYNEFSRRYSAYNPGNWYSGNTPFFSDPYGSPALITAVNTKMVTQSPGSNGPASSSWENQCAGCHQTGLTVEYRDAGNGIPEVMTGYVELNIGCEACHGSGAVHVVTKKASDIINPQKLLTSTSFANGKIGVLLANEVCGKCHQRAEGFAQFSSARGKVRNPVEYPSQLVPGSVTKAALPQVGVSLVDFFEVGAGIGAGGSNVGPGVWGTVTFNGNYGSDPITGVPQMSNFPVFAASRQHHQAWMDMEQGSHGAEKQHGSGLTCWSCHDVHSTAKPHMIRTSINGQPTDAHDNTLCLACHNKDVGFTGATNLEKVRNHIAAKISNPNKAANLTDANYLQPIRFDGTAATYGFNSYRNGECVSCHMPMTPSSSGILNDDVMKYKQGDTHNHTMKVLLTTPGADPGNPANFGPSSCSGCHAIP